MITDGLRAPYIRVAASREPRSTSKSHHVELLEWAGGADDMANGMVAIGLDVPPAWLTIYNALDENGFAFGGPEDYYRRYPLTS